MSALVLCLVDRNHTIRDVRDSKRTGGSYMVIVLSRLQTNKLTFGFNHVLPGCQPSTLASGCQSVGSRLRNLDTPLHPVRFHAAGCIHCISKQPIAEGSQLGKVVMYIWKINIEFEQPENPRGNLLEPSFLATKDPCRHSSRMNSDSHMLAANSAVIVFILRMQSLANLHMVTAWSTSSNHRGSKHEIHNEIRFLSKKKSPHLLVALEDQWRL